MPLDRSLRLEVDPQVRPETLPLGPEEYFVLSRVQGPLTVAELIVGSGLGAASTERHIERLLELGALRGAGGPAPTPAAAPVATPNAPPRRSTQELRAQAEDRRRRVLQQQLVASRRGSPTPKPSDPSPPSKAVTAEAPPASATPASAVADEAAADAAADAPVVEPVPADDPRLEAQLGLSIDDQRWLLALEDRIDELTPFEWLGLRPTHDLKVIRGAFRDSSRRLHPDAYKSRDLGRYRSLLSSFFGRAKSAYASLQREDVRASFVEAALAEQAEREREAEQQQAERKAAAELRLRQEQEQIQRRRAEREAQRSQRERERMHGAAKAKIAEYLQAAAEAEAAQSFGQAANNLRLALELAPHDAELRARWERVRLVARRRRAKDAFARAITLAQAGQRGEAIPMFLEAAESDPTIEHLASAADAVREHDPARARDLAIAALRRLAEPGIASSLPTSEVVEVRLMIGRAFLAAGQLESAAAQARLVQGLRPGDPQARVLLNSTKVT